MEQNIDTTTGIEETIETTETETPNVMYQVLEDVSKKKTISVRLGGRDGKQFKIRVNMAFDGIMVEQLLDWAFADRVIALQRALRECNEQTLQDYVEKGYSVHASTCGQKPKSIHETIGEVKSLLAGKTPEEKAKILAELGLA